MKKRLLITALFLLSLSAQSRADTVLSVDPVSQSVAFGSQAVFNINIAGLGNGTALGTYDINFGFDSSLLSYSGITFGNQLDLFGLGDLQIVTPSNGTVGVFELSLESVSDLNTLQASAFTLATLTFDTVAQGTNSVINLSANAVGDASGASLAVTLQNGSVSITAVPVPTSAFLFLTGLAMLKRRELNKQPVVSAEI